MKFICPKPGGTLIFVFAVDIAVLPLLRSILTSVGPLPEFCLVVPIFAKPNVTERSCVSVLCFKLIGLDRHPNDRMLTQDPFDLIDLPTLMPKFYSPSMARWQGSEKRFQPPVIAFQIRRQLKQYRAEFTFLMKRFEPLQHGHQHGKPFRPEATNMRNFSVGLGCIDEMGRSICEPRLHGFLGRESIPHTIEFNGLIPRGVVAKESGWFDVGWIKPIRPLPSLV